MHILIEALNVLLNIPSRHISVHLTTLIICSSPRISVSHIELSTVWVDDSDISGISNEILAYN